jgi:hypothetical protein
MNPFQGCIASTLYTLSEIIPAVNEVLRWNFIKIPGTSVPIRGVGDVLFENNYVRRHIQISSGDN